MRTKTKDGCPLNPEAINIFTNNCFSACEKKTKHFTVASHLGEEFTIDPKASYQACVDSPPENREEIRERTAVLGKKRALTL